MRMPSPNLSNKLNPNNMYYDRQAAMQYKTLSKVDREALWSHDRQLEELHKSVTLHQAGLLPAPDSLPQLPSAAAQHAAVGRGGAFEGQSMLDLQNWMSHGSTQLSQQDEVIKRLQLAAQACNCCAMVLYSELCVCSVMVTVSLAYAVSGMGHTGIDLHLMVAFDLDGRLNAKEMLSCERSCSKRLKMTMHVTHLAGSWHVWLWLKASTCRISAVFSHCTYGNQPPLAPYSLTTSLLSCSHPPDDWFAFLAQL